MPIMQNGEIIFNTPLGGGYFHVSFYAPEAAAGAAPGQFVHVRIADLRDRILRRPFSIEDADPVRGSVDVVYKVVGEGTRFLSKCAPGAVCDLMGPLGKGFSPCPDGATPVLVTGGYGVAATRLCARACPGGILLAGARSRGDLLLLDDFRSFGYDVRTATDDGSAGRKGLVTQLLEELLAEAPGRKFAFRACGPHPMLMALARMLPQAGYADAELSLDHLMCCGVGACFACVVKVKDGADGWRYARSCTEGPVFKAGEVYTGE